MRLLNLQNTHINAATNSIHRSELLNVHIYTTSTYTALPYAWGDIWLCTGDFFDRGDLHRCSSA